ncbi:MAG: alkaline phosphatase family protein [Pseudobacteriovorax sp.]|nr:alkaline phosphatase family protein [Pseudobacteriovorax sp.]
MMTRRQLATRALQTLAGVSLVNASSLLALGRAFVVPSIAALPETGTLQRITFGSCARQTRGQPIWRTIGARSPDMFLFLGDNVYADTNSPRIMRSRYADLAAIPEFAEFRSQIPIMATWDDHDYGRNDAGAEYEMRATSQQIFLDFFGVSPTSPRRERAGIYHAETFGEPGKRVQIIMLDTRYHRSGLVRGANDYRPSYDPEATFLGEEQWQWLEAVLKQPAELRIVGSSIQFASSQHRFEKWSNLPLERSRLLDTIKRTKANGVVIVSGDRHMAEISQIPKASEGAPYQIFDMTCSGMNQRNSGSRNEANRFRLPGSRTHTISHFGQIDVDWDVGDVMLSIVSIDGVVLESARVPLSSLIVDQ